MKIRWVLCGLVVIALLAPAVMMTGTRILAPGGARWVRLVSFTPYAAFLYALALLLLLLMLAFSHGAWRRLVAVLCVLVVPFLGLHLWWMSGLYAGQPAAVTKGAETFTVMTSNLSFGEADAPRVVEVAIAQHADILVLAEVTPLALERLRDAGLDDVFRYSQGEPAGGVTGTMVFATRPLADAQRLDTRSHGYAMTVRFGGKQVHLLAVHPYAPVGDARAWRADQVAVRRAAAAQDGPTVIAGDFNATLDHEPIRELEGRGFTDAAEQANSGWQPTWPSAGEVSVLGVRVPSLLAIDHVLVSEQVSVMSTESMTVAETDHRALVARLALR